MKKLLISSFVFFAIVIGVFAQNSFQGKWMIGTSTDLLNPYGSITYGANNAGISFSTLQFKSDTYESDKTNVTTVNLTPIVGAFATNNLLLSGEVSFLYSGNSDSHISAFAVGPMVRYYFNGNDKLTPFVQIGGKAGQISYGEGDDSKSNTLQFSAKSGAAFFMNDFVSIDLLAGYQHTKIADKSESDDRELINSFAFGVGLSVFL